ncbi:hypothetical protein [Streptomyces sp. NBC_00063]|uniref:hypothetical protein n=1 Tax=Streptomyces sp. NBC_00063 TaxID=2975638 RepID=UPI00225710B9|nr:hypothetical protein [Streptomyces sp. NBC_00063]
MHGSADDIARQAERDDITQQIRSVLDAEGFGVSVNEYSDIRVVERRMARRKAQGGRPDGPPPFHVSWLQRCVSV